MSISLLLPSITNAIAGVSITNVTIKDYSGIAAQWIALPNVLYPNPEGFIRDFRIDYQTFDRGATAKADVKYTLSYRFLGTQVGNLGNMPIAYADMMSKVIAIVNAMMEVTAPFDGRVDMEVSQITVGARSDPAGNVFHGADIALNITEMQNA